MKNVLIPAIAALGLIISFVLIGTAYKYKFRATENITVTGSAEKDFVSDQIVWKGNYTRKEMELKSAYAAIKEDEAKIKNYLKTKGVADSEFVFSAISIDKDYSYQYDENGRQTGSYFTGYNLRQNVTVDSKAIEKVEKISREVTELIELGIELNSSPPSYFYTKNAQLNGKDRSYYEIEGFQEGIKQFKSCEIADVDNYNMQGVIIVPSRAAFARDSNVYDIPTANGGLLKFVDRSFVFNVQVYKTTTRTAVEF